MKLLIAIIFALALFLSARTVTGFVANLIDKKPKETFFFAIVTSLMWGLFYYLTH